MKWVTRENANVDRIACPWLIRRFIDADAEFLFVAREHVLAAAAREGGHSYDAPGAEYTHRDGKCSFDVLVEELEPIFRAGHRDEWLQRLLEEDVPAAPINTLDEVFADPQVREYGFPIEVEHPKMGKMKLVGNAVDMSRTPPKINQPPPVLGEHTDEVLKSLGYDASAISSLRSKGVV